MEFCIEKCAVFMKSRKRQITEIIKLLNPDRIRTLREKETYKYLGVRKAETMKRAEMKEKNRERISQTNEKTS